MLKGLWANIRTLSFENRALEEISHGSDLLLCEAESESVSLFRLFGAVESLKTSDDSLVTADLLVSS
jgi:hypothetical protein